MPDPKLTTTSYSILGYLGVRSWTAYELAKQMGRTFHHFWPRAESGIYREVKRLVDAGLATAADERVGRRARTRYEITELGTRRLEEWLTNPHSDGFLETEGLVRVLFADHGSKETLERTLKTMSEDARERGRMMADLVHLYRTGEGEFPHRAHINLLVAKFLIEFALMVDEWSRWAREVVATWPDVDEREPDAATIEALERLEDRGRKLA